MSIGLVNLSNWDGEDIEVEGRLGGKARLKPGEIVRFAVPHEDGAESEIKVTSRPAEKTKPFMLNGEQVFPIAQAHIGRTKQE